MNPYPKLHHEDLDAYKAAIEFLAVAAGPHDQYPRGYGSMAEQLRRAALSIPLNIAEGYGKRGSDDRARFYDIARGSAHECGAILDASRVLGIAVPAGRQVDEATFARGKTLLHRIVSMPVKYAHAQERGPVPGATAVGFAQARRARDESGASAAVTSCPSPSIGLRREIH